MSFGKKLVEVGPVCIRENETNENLDFDITDFHGNQYSVADEQELRYIREAINSVLADL